MNDTGYLSKKFTFDNSYARLPERFYARQLPTRVPVPKLINLNEELAKDLGLDPEVLKASGGVKILSGNSIPEGAEPLAMAYAGHQFGNWVPELGDGRVLLLGELIGLDGVRRDIQLKGSGPTPFSRMGDGRAVLGPILREYIISEGMNGLGIPTTRTLSAVLTGEKIMREQLFPGAILTRVAQSHVRVGTFEYFSARKDIEGLRLLADYVIRRHFPDSGKSKNPYSALLYEVAVRQANLIAKWMLFGFIHGVMNTDNMQIAGETIDYGPCAFLDTYQPDMVFSSIDHMGRYAFENQPKIAQWNLICMGQAMLPLISENEDSAISQVKEAIGIFSSIYEEKWTSGMIAKLGFVNKVDGDIQIAQDLLHHMAMNGADFTLTFRRLCDLSIKSSDSDDHVRDLFSNSKEFDGWIIRWRRRLLIEGLGDVDRKAAMETVNPAFIPRNHLVDEAIRDALNQDYGLFEKLLKVYKKPFNNQPEFEHFMKPPLPHQKVNQTFCGT